MDYSSESGLTSFNSPRGMKRKADTDCGLSSDPYPNMQHQPHQQLHQENAYPLPGYSSNDCYIFDGSASSSSAPMQLPVSQSDFAATPMSDMLGLPLSADMLRADMDQLPMPTPLGLLPDMPLPDDMLMPSGPSYTMPNDGDFSDPELWLLQQAYLLMSIPTSPSSPQPIDLPLEPLGQEHVCPSNAPQAQACPAYAARPTTHDYSHSPAPSPPGSRPHKSRRSSYASSPHRSPVAADAIPVPRSSPSRAATSTSSTSSTNALSDSEAMPPPPRPRPSKRPSGSSSSPPRSSTISAPTEAVHPDGFVRVPAQLICSPPHHHSPPDPTRPTIEQMIAKLAASQFPLSAYYLELFRKYNMENISLDDVVRRQPPVSINAYQSHLSRLEDFCRMRLLSERLAAEAREEARARANVRRSPYVF